MEQGSGGSANGLSTTTPWRGAFSSPRSIDADSHLAQTRNQYAYKRTVDVIVAIVALTVLAPLFALVALSIACTSKGPAIYRSTRIGRGGETFGCLKFRTMVKDAEERLAELLRSDSALRIEYARTQKLKADPRVTRLGAFLRKTSLDELPQFWNVLVGDMSVVGPRPLLPDEQQKYGEAFRDIISVRPGLTGPWQVNGRNKLPYEKRVSLAREYARSSTFMTDLRIMMRTPYAVFQGDKSGAY